LHAKATLLEITGRYRKIAEHAQPLEIQVFCAPLRKKASPDNKFEPFQKTPQKRMLWREFGEKTACWREKRGDLERYNAPLSAPYHLLLTIKNKDG